MTTINERFKRAYKVLEEEFSNMDTDIIDTVREEGPNLMWLRNEAKLWEDYEEDTSMIIDGVNQDPNHPDNLSDIVWRSFKLGKLGWYCTND